MKNRKFEMDFYRMTYCRYSFKEFFKKFFKRHDIRFIYYYRNQNKNIIYKVLFKIMSNKYGLEIFSEDIGEGLYIGHPYWITINPKVKIGKNCNIHKGVTIGQENRGKRKGVPIIGDRVWIGVNATIVGRVSIGNDVLVAPNTYINIDVPSHSIVIGNPCKIILKENATNEYINYIV